MTSSRSFGDESPPVSDEWLARQEAPSLEVLVCRPALPTTGAPVLFLHGAFAGAWCWQENWLPRLAATGRFAAAVSLRGHGGSEGRDSLRWAGLTAFQNDLTDAIAAMPSPPVVVAHSLGGLVAQQVLGLALAGLVGLRGLVLVGSLPPEGLMLIAPGLGLKTWLAILSGTADVLRASCFADRNLRTGDGTWNATVTAAHAAFGGDVPFHRSRPGHDSGPDPARPARRHPGPGPARCTGSADRSGDGRADRGLSRRGLRPDFRGGSLSHAGATGGDGSGRLYAMDGDEGPVTRQAMHEGARMRVTGNLRADPPERSGGGSVCSARDAGLTHKDATR